jgi:SNF2 family DNA or RNA helicase
VAAITGATPQAERERIRRDFQAGKLRVVVGQVKAVKMGMDFSRADYLFYLSNSYSQDDRTQSEDRGNHTQKTGILQVVDLCTKGGNDRKLVSLLTTKKALSRSYIEETLSKWSEEFADA